VQLPSPNGETGVDNIDTGERSRSDRQHHHWRLRTQEGEISRNHVTFYFEVQEAISMR